MKVIAVILTVTMIIGILPMTVLAQAVEDEKEKFEQNGYSSNVSQEEEEPTVIGEDTERRNSENTKYFKMSDGTIKAAMYNAPVLYKDGTGKWQEIDNSLDSSNEVSNDEASDFNGYETKKNKFKVKFAKNANQKKLVSMKMDNYSVSLSLLNKTKKNNSSMKQEKKAKIEDLTVASKASQKVYYENILPDTNIEYIVNGSGVKENIVVKSAQSSYEYNFEIAVKDVTLSLAEDGCIYAKDTTTGATVFVMPKPFMLDAKYEYSDKVSYSLSAKNKHKYEITISADSEWLNSSERSFPVTIDPAIQTKQSISTIDSVYVAKGLPNQNRYSDPMMMVGRESTDADICQGLIKFALPKINRGDVVIDAQLLSKQVLMDAYSDTTPDTAIEVHAITKSWNVTTVTWNTKPTYESTVADFEILKASEKNSGAKDRQWNVTSIVKRWYENPNFANNGLLLRSSNENKTSYNDSCIYMWVYGEKYAQSTAYPMLYITYRSNKGLESYWSYTDISAGRAGTASICEFSGNLVFTHNDVTTAGSRAPASISHVFNNYMAAENFGTVMPYRGKGWMLSCQQQLLPSSKVGLPADAQKTYPYVYIDGDGTEHYFYKKSDGTMVDEDGMGLTLTVPGKDKNGYYIVKDDKGNQMIFNVAGAFARSRDSNGNQIANYYAAADNPKIWKVTDGAGHAVTFTPTSDSKTIQKITDSSGRVTTYTWNSDGRLTTITYPDGKETKFTYDSDGAMTSVIAPDGYKLQFTYTPLAKGKRVSKVVESANGTAGQTITFDYSQYGQTVIRSSGKDGVYGNSDDVYTTVKFDSAGRTVCSEATSNGKSLAASAAEYTASSPNSNASNIKQLNRLSKSMTGGQYVRNYLRDGSADISGTWTKAQWNGTADFVGQPVDTDQLYGRYSYYLNSKTFSDKAAARAYQPLSSGQFGAGKTYTFSAWVKTKNIVPRDASIPFGAELMVTYWLSNNKAVDVHSDVLVGTTDSTINNGWQRLAVTFTLPSDATRMNINIMVRDATGEAWFDGMQLEEGTSASPFNMINNSSFERYSQASNGAYLPQDWSGHLFDSGDSVHNTHQKDDGHSFRFNSVPTVEKSLIQTLYFKGKTAQNLDDTYILSGWVYANPVGGSNENNRVGLAIKIFYSDGTYYVRWFDYNNSVMGSQYVMGAFTLRDGSKPTANKTPTSMNVYLINFKQSNNSWFDNIQLVRDEAPSYTYNSDGKLVTVAANAKQKGTMEYSNGNLTKSVDAKGFNYSYKYDDNHNMTEATNQSGVKYAYVYDKMGNPTSLKVKVNDNYYIETGATYTANGAYVSQTSDQDGYTESYSYNDTRGTLTKYTDKMGRVTNYTYDNNTDAVTSVSQTLSNGQTVSNSYTYDNYRLKTISHNGFNYSFAYDNFGNVTQTKVGSQVLSTNTYGNNNGDLKQVEYGNGNKIGYTYDDYGNISAISQNGTKNFTWQYDSTGNLYSHEDLVNNQRFVYTYDSTGRLVRQQVLDNSKKNIYSSQYGYDLNNNVSRFASSAGGVSVTENFEYGKDNLASKYTYPSGKTTTYTYDGLMRRIKALTNTSVNIDHQYAYLASARGNTVKSTKIGWEHIGNYIYGYTYDANGNITKITRRDKTVANSAYEPQQQFAYDELNQLIRADDLAKNRTEVYTYDNGGNILSTTVYPLTWGSLSGVTATDTTTYTYGDSNWKDKLTAYGDTPITYDAIGNPLTYRGYTLTWQNGRQLASMKYGAINIGFTYDVDGLRTSKTIPNVGLEHKYYYVGNRLQYETLGGSSALWYFYDADGNPSGIRYKNGDSINDYYFVCNWRGDVIQIYNASGTLVGSYTYDAWGRVTENATSADTENITETNPIRYRGYYYDTETRLYYVSSRYYDPAVKRFLNSDDELLSATSPETLTDKNYFAYCDNNPVSRTDGEGTIWHIVVGAVIGGALNSIDDIVNIVSTYKSGGSQEEKTKAWVHLGLSFASGAVSGGLAMSGVGPVASISINAVVSLGDEGIDQLIDKEFNAKNLIVAGIEGALGGIDTGGSVARSARKAGLETVRKTSTTARNVFKNKGFKSAAKAYARKASKQAARYVKNTKPLSIQLLKNAIGTLATYLAKKSWSKIYKKWFR